MCGMLNVNRSGFHHNINIMVQLSKEVEVKQNDPAALSYGLTYEMVAHW